MKKIEWKHFANWMKLFVGLEVALIFVLGKIIFKVTDISAWDLIQIGLFQYGLFAPVDVSMIVKSIRGEPVAKG